MIGEGKVWRMGILSTSMTVFCLFIIAADSSAGSHELFEADELREVLYSDLSGNVTLTVIYYENGLVDIAVNDARGETLYFHSERTSYRCTVSCEEFMIGEILGSMVLVTTCNGGNYNPYESWAIFVRHSDNTIYQSTTPAECHNMGGPGPYYPNQLDVDGDGIYDHLSYPSYLFYLPNECQALKRQLWIDFCKLPSISSAGKIELEDNTLSVLIDPGSQNFRDSWIESMSDWLQDSVELSQSNPTILEVRNKVWAFKEALVNNNYELISELYPDL